MDRKELLANEKMLANMIYEIRGQKVMLDFELAEIYGYETKRFNEQVKNNIARFDDDFMFQLTKVEFDNILKSKKSVSSWGGQRKLPKAFTEQGIYMLMTILDSDLAVKQSKSLVRLFKAMKDIVSKNENQHLHFGKQVMDNSWNLFVNMLDYKLKEQGKTLIKIDKYFPSSQKCSCCGKINKVVKDFSIRKWTCPSCGQIHNRDINAAINIREEGKRLFFDRYNRGTHGVNSPMLGS